MWVLLWIGAEDTLMYVTYFVSGVDTGDANHIHSPSLLGLITHILWIAVCTYPFCSFTHTANLAYHSLTKQSP